MLPTQLEVASNSSRTIMSSNTMGRPMLHHFFLDDKFTHLNHGSFGTIPRPVHEACSGLARTIEHNPDLFMRKSFHACIDASRTAISRHIGIPLETCVLIPNVATGLNTIFRNIEWDSNDTIICSNMAYHSVALAIEEICDLSSHPKSIKVNLNFPTTRLQVIQSFCDALSLAKTKQNLHMGRPAKIIVVIESITSTPALLIPWKEIVSICRELGALTIVDAAHSLGQELKPDLLATDPDFWLADCSKWFYAERGCSILYTPLRNQNMIKKAIIPSMVFPVPGGPRSDFENKFYWHGLVDLVVPLSLEPALAFRQSIGGDDMIFRYCHGLAVAGSRLLSEILGTHRLISAEIEEEMVPFMVNVLLPLSPVVGHSVEVYDLLHNGLLEKQIISHCFYFNDHWWTRVSVQIYNELSDFEKLGIALKTICREVDLSFK